MLYCYRKEKTHFHLRHDRRKAIAFCPVMLIQVAEDDNAVFGADGCAMFISFDGRNGHGWKSIADYGAKCLVLFFRDVFPCFCRVVKTQIFFKVGLVPYEFV